MWHFTTITRKLRYGDNRLVEAGQTLEVTEPLVLCKSGLHASERLLDALAYAPGPFVWSVELDGTRIDGADKSCATKRTAIWGYDATNVLKEFSRKVALDAVNKHWDKKFGKFPDIVIKWLETGDESIRSDAWSAARSAWSAARSAESAARSAESAARSAWSAARSDAELNDLLTKMVIDARPLTTV